MHPTSIISGFSKMSKDEKIRFLTQFTADPEKSAKELRDFWHPDPKKQKLFDEFSENTVSNHYFPFGVAPNFLINGKFYLVPFVIEESSVVAAASNSAKFWASRGGFHAEVLSSTKIGQVHFIWEGDFDKLKRHFPAIRERLIAHAAPITANMVRRGGGILDIELVDKRNEIENYYQVKATFETVDSMGANFINSCLEDFAMTLKGYVLENDEFDDIEKECHVIMSILSNYTPECLVRTYVECDMKDLGNFEDGDTPESFTWKFERAIKIATVDVHRATTHNKGIFNGIDAVVLATGNDFRAVEAAGHTFASRSGQYRSLTEFSREGNKFRYSLTMPLAIGTVGGLTALHPLAKFSLELLGNPNGHELMMIAATSGLANNFGAVTTLVTKGIQTGHMKMHLLNILNHFKASEVEKDTAIEYFRQYKVTFPAVREFLEKYRNKEL